MTFESPICLADVALPGVSKGCTHQFCEPYLTAWLARGKRTCPLCRAAMPRSPLEGEESETEATADVDAYDHYYAVEAILDFERRRANGRSKSYYLIGWATAQQRFMGAR